jgi:hypothetical protein
MYGIWGRETTKYTIVYGVKYTILANPTVVASTQLCRATEQLQGRAGSFKDTSEKEEDTHAAGNVVMTQPA